MLVPYNLLLPKWVLKTKRSLGLRTRLKYVLGYATIGGRVPYNWRQGMLQLVAGYATIGGGVPYNWRQDPYCRWQGTLQLVAGYTTIGGRVRYNWWQGNIQLVANLRDLPPTVGYPTTNCRVLCHQK